MKRQVKNVIANYRITFLFILFSVISVLLAAKTGCAAVIILLFAGVIFILEKREKNKLTTFRRLSQNLLSVNEVTQSFAVATETEETLETIFLALKEILPLSKRILLFWIKQEGWRRTIEGRDAFGMDLSEVRKFVFPLDETLGIIPRVAITRKTFETLDARNEYYCDQNFVEKTQIFSFIAVPIIVGQQTLGVFMVETEGKKLHTEAEIKMLSFFANAVGIALENARLYKQVEALSILDGLTGLYNHRHFQELLYDELKRCERYQHSFSLLMLDIDLFKKYNDTYGHPVGDAVLASVARIIREDIRNTDIAARYGGDEFCVILTETDKDGALYKAEAIRKAVEKHPFLIQGEKSVIKLTVSIGAATFPEDARNKEDLIKKADQALYRAKKEGRNRVFGI